jgi:hypothetical protein
VHVPHTVHPHVLEKTVDLLRLSRYLENTALRTGVDHARPKHLGELEHVDAFSSVLVATLIITSSR